MYSCVEAEASLCVEPFRLEAQRLLVVEVQSPQATDMVAAMFLSLGHLVQGKDHAVVQHLYQAVDIGVQLGLFAASEARASEARAQFTPSETVALAYPCWGVFNWIVYAQGLYFGRLP